MPNSDTSAALSFHDATKLNYISLSTKPPLYKSYPGLPTVALPAEMPSPEAPTLPAVGGVMSESPDPLDLAAVAQLLHYSAGLIRRSTLRTAGEVHYRAAASAGALYPIELYVVCGDLPGLAAGLYHYSPSGNSLSLLRSGNFRGNLAAATAGHPSVADAPATIVCSSVFWRSAWKYRERGYRYCYWDNGTILANMTATANALGLSAEIVAGFVDSEVDALLGLESSSEATFCLVPIGNGSPTPPAVSPLDAVDAGVLGVERRTEYPETSTLHAGSVLANTSDVARWQNSAHVRKDSANAKEGPDSALLGATIAHRGSTRRFAREAMPTGRLEALLAACTSPVPADYGGGLIDTYLIVNAAEGISPGTYFYSPEEGQLQLLAEGEFREEAGHLCFEQALGADASAVAYFMADLDSILSRFGNRGYRIAQLEAGIMGGRMYLATHSMGLGATGMTFYDEAVTAFFSPHAAGKSLMFLVGLGITHERNQVHPFRSRIGILKDSLARGAGAQGRDVPDWLYA
ncbi:Putative nitroreductase MJ1384 [Geodia barretti]|uniref:Nitroreductase MJ1384 n=1 Tax=Geodia barretti TaxID=519541 RepID=A0AA35WBF7_GEOBA|nr:Putative nitroreductase MJ1384 [Geodia barretti]